VVPVPLQIVEQILGQQRAPLVPLVCIHYLLTLLRVLRVLPVLLQILEQILGQQRVLLVPLARIHYLQLLRRVRPVPPLPTPPLFNAPLVPIKKLPRAMQDIMGILVVHLVNRVLPESAVLLLLQRPLNVKRVRLAGPVPTGLPIVKIVQQVHIKMK
jgi:hypothetical protein